MDEMREIVTVEQANRVFLLLAVGLPILGLVLGAAVGARRRKAALGAKNGFLIGLLGPLNLLLWKVYNVLTDRFGLDSVKNLFVNLALFVLLGIVAGLVFRRLQDRFRPGGADGEGPAMVGALADGPAPVRSSGAARRMEESDEPPRDQ